MEGEYACNLNNRFELFLDDENDPLELLAKTEQEKRKTGSDKKDAKKDAKKKGLSKSLVESVKTIAAAVDSKAPAKPLGRQNQNNPPSSQGGPGANRPPRRANDNLDKRNNEKNFEPRPEGGDRFPRENRGPRGDGQRGPRGNFPHGGGGGAGGRGREFDRRSGDVRSGVKPVVKRGGQGQYNWGDPTETEVQEQEAAPETREEATEGAAAAEGETAEAPAEVEAPVMSLEQWKKEQAAKKSKAEYSGNIRKPNEGEKEDPKLKKAVVLKKKKADQEEEEEGDAEESEDEDMRHKKELEKTLASQFHFADSRGPSRGGRGGRSGPGGRHDGPPRERREPGSGPSGGSAGGPSGGFHGHPRQPRQQQQQHTPRVEDLNDFPSLAA